MTAAEYREALERLKLSQMAAARLLGASPRASRYWASEGAPPQAAILLRLLLAGTITAADVEAARQQ